MSIHEIPFPGITICHPQNVMEYKSREFVRSAKFPLGATPEYTLEILPLLAGFTERQWIVPRIEDLEMIDAILDANNLTVKGAIDKLGTVCADFLLVCVFAGKKFPCFQQHPYMKFEESYSYLGACCSFNYHPNTVATADFFKANTFGIDGGLSVVGTGRPQASDGRSGAIYSEGFVVIVHHPNDFAVESAPTTYIDLKKETFVDIQPIHSSCSSQVLVLPFAQRKCIIPADKGKLNYRQPECMLECLRDEIHQRCQCHPFHLPRASNQTNTLRNCRAVDILCMVDNYFQFKTAKCDHCFPSCSDVVYKTTSFKMNIDQLDHAIDDLYTYTNITDTEFVVRIFFGGQRVAANKKIVVMSWISLLSNLGGAFSLCLGMSILSMCEILFFIFVRMIKHYKRIFQVGPVIPKFNKNDEKK
ncbi:sodium channel protein Nach-like [Chironomus tepperi]|uniref:sodium channel protein Nach-like n=1 Tax=Chironomus tepperi TaxID=113505 RepID=UPI00391EFBB0